FRAKDYASVGVPMLPITAGGAVTRRQILAYTVILLPISWFPVAVGTSGWLYAAIATGLGIGFIAHAARLWQDGTQRSATKTFRFSIFYLFGIFGGLVADDMAVQMMPLLSGWLS
ncbi:MAG: UbiA family prenyltransferase, partial [Geminicoccaceae bacterium]